MSRYRVVPPHAVMLDGHPYDSGEEFDAAEPVVAAWVAVGYVQPVEPDPAAETPPKRRTRKAS